MLLVSNIPPNLSNPDGLFYAFERFGTVERIKAGLASIPKLCATDGYLILIYISFVRLKP